MKQLAITLSVVFLVFASYAQQDKRSTTTPVQEERSTIKVAEANDPLNSDYGGSSGYKHDYLGEKGSMYLFKNWEPAVIVLSDGNVLENRLVRYDLYHQQMQFVYNGDTLAFASPDEISHVTVHGKKYVFTDFIENSKMNQSLMEVLNDGKCKLLVNKRVDYIILSNNSCVISKHYYIKKGENPAEEVGLKCKYVVSAFPGDENEIRRYIKKNKLRFKTCKDLCRVVEYYNSLTQQP